MSEKAFLHRPILEELTDEVKDKGFDPYEAYVWLYEKQKNNKLRSETYCSTSITSGGHARDDSLSIQEIIARNNESAKMLAEQLAFDGQINPETSIEPVFVGKTGWNQAEYMEFWLSVIGGFEFDKGSLASGVDGLRSSIQRAFKEEKFNIDIINSNVSADERAKEYFKMSSAFAELILKGAPATPIDKVIRMIDTEQSLGAQTERAFARQIGSKVMNICLIKPAEIKDLATINRVLYKDIDRLIQFGSTIFDTRNNKVSLILSEDVA